MLFENRKFRFDAARFADVWRSSKPVGSSDHVLPEPETLHQPSIAARRLSLHPIGHARLNCFALSNKLFRPFSSELNKSPSQKSFCGQFTKVIPLLNEPGVKFEGSRMRRYTQRFRPWPEALGRGSKYRSRGARVCGLGQTHEQPSGPRRAQRRDVLAPEGVPPGFSIVWSSVSR